MKRYLVTALLIGYGIVVPAHSQDKEIHDISDKLSAGLLASGKKNVAVVDFTDLQGCVTELGRFMAEEFSASLAEEGKGFEVVDRTNLNVILKENHLAERGVIDPSAVRKIGQIAGVDALISGTLTPLGDTVHVVVKVLDSTDARVIVATRGDIARTKGMDELLAKGVTNCAGLATSLGNQGPSQTSAGMAPAQSPGEVSSLQWGDMVITIDTCRHSSDQIRCLGTIVNKGKEREYTSIDGNSSIIDNFGNQSSGFRQINIGSGSDFAYLDPDLPLRFSIQSSGFADDATSVSISISVRVDNNYVTHVLRHIPLQK